jgi:glycosyltransferase involved in cell wall biosynthesis
MAVISIVTATLNRTEYLKEAIESALAQTFSDFELLICDDGARAETKQLCESFGDRRLRHIVNDSPLGIAMNTYSGVMNSKTGLIAFLNDDDRWTPDFLLKCARPLLVDTNTVLAFSDHWVIDSSGIRLLTESDETTRRYGRNSLQPGYVKETLGLLANYSIPLAMASVFRKSAIDWSLFSKRVGGQYDYFLSYSLLRSGGAIVYVPERLTEYRAHSGSATAKFHISNLLAGTYVNRVILSDPRFLPIAPIIRANLVGLERQLAKQYLRNFHLPLAVAHLARSLQSSFG